MLDVPLPDPATPDNAQNAYVFERAITRTRPDGSSTTNYIDFYRRSCFVLECKQGADAPDTPSPLAAPRSTPLKTGHGTRGTAAFDKALERAYHQARGYITALPPEEGRPPFLIVCDVGATIDLYADFSGTGGIYERFPDPVSHRIHLEDLARPEIRERLRQIWLDPHSLDPAKIAAKVTRDIAARLAVLAKSLEASGHDSHLVAAFLQRCLFTMFAEDIGLLPPDSFASLLERARTNPRGFPVLVSNLWREMNTGADYSTVLFAEVARFNGGLFADTSTLPLDADQIALLADAASVDWSGVEPSIFGTLLVRALDPHERHKLGAEYTPRAYVERLIRAVIIHPLRDRWETTRIAAAALHDEAAALLAEADEIRATSSPQLSAADARKLDSRLRNLRSQANKKDAEALQQVTDFHHHLCRITVLDPACGTANFLYVTMEHLKRLEAEVLELISALGGQVGLEMSSFRIRPEQFIGLEINSQAVAIAQLVLWIGYFQWQRKTTGRADPGDRPLLPKHQSIHEQDAVLVYDDRVPRLDPDTGEVLTIWDGYTTKPHPITGKEVPDEAARKVLFDFVNPRCATWLSDRIPAVTYVVGNPPFLGTSRMREALGDGYTEALRGAWRGKVPESADFVMFWWCHAAELLRDGKIEAFGFITTNSISQTFNRRVIELFLEDAEKPIHISYAIPDHPWIDGAEAAAVRIAMTAAKRGKGEGRLRKVLTEKPLSDGEKEVTLSSEIGTIAANLKIGAGLTSCEGLKSNNALSSMGVKLHGKGFLIDHLQADIFIKNNIFAKDLIFPYISSRSLVQSYTNQYAIDAFGLEESDLKDRTPEIYQHLCLNVKPERDQNRRESYRFRWWIYGEPRKSFRPSLRGLKRMLSTPRTAKHRIFLFLDLPIVAESEIVCIALDDAIYLGILSSSIHTSWALAQGSVLGPTPRYNNTRCFETFPFPEIVDTSLASEIRDLGERLDAHRKRQQAQHTDLTLTDCYNILVKLRTGEALTAKDKRTHEHGLITLLKQLHDALDDAVLRAYGWTDLLAATPLADRLATATDDSLEQTLLTRLVDLNHRRAELEATEGIIHYLRPDYQNPSGIVEVAAPSLALPLSNPATVPVSSQIHPTKWPDDLPAQVLSIRQLLPALGTDPKKLSAHFGRPNSARESQIQSILATLQALGHIDP